MLKGKITISNPRSSDSTDCVQIQVEDVKSNTRFLKITMNHEDFAYALLGLGNVDCQFELTPKYVDMVYQHEIRQVFVPSGEFRTIRQRADDAVKALEGDGWTGRFQDAMNHHQLIERTEGGELYSVLYSRYVEDRDNKNTEEKANGEASTSN